MGSKDGNHIVVETSVEETPSFERAVKFLTTDTQVSDIEILPEQ